MQDIDTFIQRIMSKLDQEIDWDARDAEIQAARERECDRALGGYRKDKRNKLHAGDFPGRAIESAIEANETPAIARVRAFVSMDRSADKTLLVLSGGVGCGKTVAATWAMYEHGGGCPAFMRAASFAAAGRFDRDLRDRWMNASGLVLDDLGAEYIDSKGSFLVDLDELLDRYYGDRKLLVVTTNLTSDAFKARYGGDSGRIVSRVREAGVWASCGADDLRRNP